MKIDQVDFVKGATSLGHMPEGLEPEFAFVGRSNVGKSSLINRLLERRNLARTSSTPGKTQEINFFRVNDAFHIVDLPGFGYAKVSKRQREKWQQLIGTYLMGRPQLVAVFQLVDARHEPTALDRELMMLMTESPAEHVILLTKGDKLSGNQRQSAVARVRKTLQSLGQEKPVILTSAKDGRGRGEILDWMQTWMMAS
ncbi:MAG: ribosome biogenesis GTP-binding protein YihA/YsxC [Bacteroidota bacterium]|nr:ribosome biogenesis GTP-binding protein YihA/YsxC [Bacteroidota bacterium]